MSEKQKFMIIDGNALVHRAFHALPPLSTKEGMLVNAVYGFTTVLMKALKELKPAYAAVTFDLPGPTFRDELYKEYKAQRIKQPDELYAQIPLIKEVVRAFGISVVEKQGFEADDVIATLSGKSQIPNPKSQIETIIVTGDMDTLQLVDEHTKVYGFRKGFSDTVIYDEAAVKERYGLVPSQMVDYKALRGDPSDNIPGVKGIGEKGAATLLQEFGSLEGVYKHVAECGMQNAECRISERILKLLKAYKQDALMGKKLVTLVRDVQIDVALEDCKVLPPDTKKLREVFEKFGFKNLIVRLEEGGKKAQGSLLSSSRHSEEPRGDEESHTANKGLGSLAKLGMTFIKEGGTIIGHDIKSILHTISYILPSPFFDTMIAAYLLNPGSRAHDLESIVQEHLPSPQPSPMGGEEPVRGLLQKLVPILKQELDKNGLWPVFSKIEMPLIPVLYAMEKAGIKVDTTYLKKLSKEFEAKLAELTKKIYALAGQEFNIASPVQLREILFVKMELAPEIGRIKKTAKGGVASTAAGQLEKLRGAHPIVDLIFDYRELAKLQSTYTGALLELVDKKDSRVHTTFNQAVTATGRLSSSNPNLQNIPIRTENGRLIRQAFIAEKGFVLLSADYSQIELRVAASLSNDPEMIKAFQSGHDFHSETASRIFGVSPERVMSEMRRNAKVINFGIIYGMGATALAQSTGMPRSEAEQFIERYFEVFHVLRDYLEGLKEQARTKGYVETLFGRRRYLPEITSGVQQVRAAAERMAINMPVQGCLPATTKVLTSHGYVGIGELYKMRRAERPQMVWDGIQWRKYEVLDRGKSELAEIALSNGYILRCDTRHIILTAGDEGYVWKSFLELEKGDWVCCSMPHRAVFESAPHLSFQYNPNAHNSLPIRMDGLDEEFWYWLGYYYGDGWVTRRKGKNQKGKLYDKTVLEYAFGYEEQDKMLRCKEYFIRLGLKPCIRKFTSPALPRRDKFILSIESRGLGQLLEKVGVNLMARARTKRFLPRIFGESLMVRSVFLRGFLDADGWYGRHSRDVTTIHLCQRKLLEDTHLLLRTIGIPSKIRGPYRRGVQISYRLDIPRSYIEDIILGNRRVSAPKLGFTAPRFLINALLNQYPRLKKQIFLNNSDYVIYRRLQKGGVCSLYYFDYFIRKYNLDIGLPIYDIVEVVNKQRQGTFETTYTLSVDGSHRFDSEGIISKNTAADLIKMAMIKVYEHFHNPTLPPLNLRGGEEGLLIRMLLQVHDELVFEVNDDIVKEIAPRIQEIMEKIYLLKVPIKVDLKQGQNWGEMNHI